MMKEIMGDIIGILGIISIFWLGYEVGKFRGMAKAEKLFEKSINKMKNEGK